MAISKAGINTANNCLPKATTASSSSSSAGKVPQSVEVAFRELWVALLCLRIISEAQPYTTGAGVIGIY